ncbi:hypothetical protein Tco_1009844 [Tanacetum coccineum]
MHMIGMTMKPLQVNTKFVNHLQSEWGKFVTNVNLAKDMHTTNFDHLYAHLRQHEAHKNEVHVSRQRILPSAKEFSGQSILYDTYVLLSETKNLVFQNTSSSAQQDELLTIVIEEMSIQVAKCNKVQQENLIVHETLTAELERYKEQVKIFEQIQKFELNDTEKYIDGQLRQVIVDRNAKVADFEKQIYSLKVQLNAIAKSHKTLSTTVECLKKESKQKEDKYLDEVINLQNKNKALDNVVYKMGQSTQTMHMLTKPQAFYDESHKTTLGYQNPFYLSQARRKVPALYDGNTIVKTHAALSIRNLDTFIIS